MGLIDARDLTKIALPAGLGDGFWASETTPALNGHAHAPATLQNGTARDVMRADPGFIPAIFSLENALLTLDRYDASALPVLDEEGRYRGVVSRADVLSAMSNGVRPALVGGMATPLGVWLTDGTRSGGAPPLGLFLSGVLMAFCLFAATGILGAFLWPFSHDWAMMAFSGRIGAALDNSGGWFNLGATVLHGVIFLGLFRLMPIAGVHAAEHQTVWALERGLPLTPEFVEKMPRAHPRCGTNLMALSGLIMIAITHLPDFSPPFVLMVLIFAFFFWRSFGTALQQNFTTRPASKKQIAGGIRAAQELIAKYQEEPFVQAPATFRLLNSGIFWAALGIMSASALLEWGLLALSRWILGAGN